MSEAGLPPMLLRCFVRHGSHNKPTHFRGSSMPTPEVELHVWLDDTLEDTLALLRGKHEPCLLANCARMSLARVRYVDDFKVWQLEQVCLSDDKIAKHTLKNLGFLPGDLLDVALLN